ncbi:MAG: glycosyltransferase [Candidatus Rokubacteria bacterium]|nr:glycosyltransferase [Candidatus Rokubacteria bacterium]
MTPDRLRVLVLSSTVPYPPYGGGRMRIYQVLRRLGRDHDVDLLALAPPGVMEPENGLARHCRRVAFVPAPPPRTGVRRWSVALKHLATLTAFDEHPDVRQAVVALGDRYDVVVVENVYMLPYAAALRDVPTIVDVFGLWAGGVVRDLAAQTRWTGRLHVLVTWLKAKRVERGLRHIVDAVSVVSESDRRYLAAIDPALTISVAPNGVDTALFVPEPESPPPPLSLLFTGAMDYGANEDAVLHFLREIFPLIRASRPDTRLSIVGRDPRPAVLAHARDPGVTVTGEVADVRPFLARATVVVVPMRLGSGTRLKILEALAMARPVVSTRIGVEGIALVPGRHVEVADEPARFADAVVRLANDAGARARLGQQGRALVEAGHDWQAVLSPLADAVVDVARRRPRRVCRT